MVKQIPSCSIRTFAIAVSEQRTCNALLWKDACYLNKLPKMTYLPQRMKVYYKKHPEIPFWQHIILQVQPLRLGLRAILNPLFVYITATDLHAQIPRQSSSKDCLEASLQYNHNSSTKQQQQQQTNKKPAPLSWQQQQVTRTTGKSSRKNSARINRPSGQ